MPLTHLTPMTLSEQGSVLMGSIKPIQEVIEMGADILKGLTKNIQTHPRSIQENIDFIVRHELKTRKEIEAIPDKDKESACQAIVNAHFLEEKAITLTHLKMLSTMREEIIQTHKKTLESCEVFYKTVAPLIDDEAFKDSSEMEELCDIANQLNHAVQTVEYDSKRLEAIFKAVDYIQEGENLLKKLGLLLITKEEYTNILERLDKAKEQENTSRSLEEQITFIITQKLMTREEIDAIPYRNRTDKIALTVATELRRYRKEAFDTCYMLAIFRSNTVRELKDQMLKECRKFRGDISVFTGSLSSRLSQAYSRGESATLDEGTRIEAAKLQTFTSLLPEEFKVILISLSMRVKSLMTEISIEKLDQYTNLLDSRLAHEARVLDIMPDAIDRLIHSTELKITKDPESAPVALGPFDEEDALDALMAKHTPGKR